MRSFIFALTFPLVQFAGAQTTPDQHPLTIQVVASHLKRQCSEVRGSISNCDILLSADVVVEAHHYELVAEKTNQDKKIKREILTLGNYKGSLVKDDHSKPYRSYRVYELQYPDGETEQFTVVGETTQ